MTSQIMEHQPRIVKMVAIASSNLCVNEASLRGFISAKKLYYSTLKKKALQLPSTDMVMQPKTIVDNKSVVKKKKEIVCTHFTHDERIAIAKAIVFDNETLCDYLHSESLRPVARVALFYKIFQRFANLTDSQRTYESVRHHLCDRKCINGMLIRQHCCDEKHCILCLRKKREEVTKLGVACGVTNCKVCFRKDPKRFGEALKLKLDLLGFHLPVCVDRKQDEVSMSMCTTATTSTSGSPSSAKRNRDENESIAGSALMQLSELPMKKRFRHVSFSSDTKKV